MNVLVTGGTGLLSGPVVDHLVRRGAQVTIFHRRISGGRPGVKELVGERADHAGFVGTVRDQGPWDCIIEMIGGVPEDAVSLSEAARGMADHVIFCSTTTVYGRPFREVPVREEGAILAPPSPYGEGKLACENFLKEAEARGEFAVTVIRPGHIFNAASRPLHSLGNRTSHLDRIRHGRPIVVHDDGLGLWSSLWAEDAAEAVAEAVFAREARGRTYHLAGREPYTWNAYHNFLAEGLGVRPPEILRVPVDTLAALAPDRTLQVRRTLRFPGVYDCSAAARDLGFAPSVSAREGFFRNVRHLAATDGIERWEEDAEYEEIVKRTGAAGVTATSDG